MKLYMQMKIPIDFLWRLARVALQLAVFIVPVLPARADVKDLVINEILASNRQTLPPDIEGQFEDMIEIYNPSDVDISIKGLLLTDKVKDDGQGNLIPVNPWTIPSGSVKAKNFVMIFCDGDPTAGSELHARFQLNQQGELVALFTRENELIDLVEFPRLARDTSYGRYPDGADTFYHIPEPTFVRCPLIGCGTASVEKARNKEGGNIPPEVDLRPIRSISDDLGIADVGKANPAPDVPLLLDVKVWDEKESWSWKVEPSTGDISYEILTGQIIERVTVFYRVNGGEERSVDLEVDQESTFLLTRPDPMDHLESKEIPDTNHSIWKGEIPGQPAGSLMTFYFKVVDRDGAFSTDPRQICGKDPSTDCSYPFDYYDDPFQYQVGYQFQGSLVINEVVPLNLKIILDITDEKFDDYIELYSSEDMSLAGIWLSQNPFKPRGWQFPMGSSIGGGDHLIVWCDNDPEDTNASSGRYHTSFALNSDDGEELFLFDSEANGFGLIDAFQFTKTNADEAWSRCPDGSRESPFKRGPASPGEVNPTSLCGNEKQKFIRGDADFNGLLELTDVIVSLGYLFKGEEAPPCLDALDVNDLDNLDLTDQIYLLEFLFLTGRPPAPPFPEPGEDPTDNDSLDCAGP